MIQPSKLKNRHIVIETTLADTRHLFKIYTIGIESARKFIKRIAFIVSRSLYNMREEQNSAIEEELAISTTHIEIENTYFV